VTGTTLLWRRWAPEILLALSDGPTRFNRLLSLRRPDADWLISDRILTVRLRELEDGGLVMRHVDVGPPVRVRYGLTNAGRRYVPVLKALTALDSEPALEEAAVG
jgi:DNA-binding HxlR family transcriptional regulator